MNKFKHHYYNSILKEADSKGGAVARIYLRACYLKELPDFIKDLSVEDTFDVTDNILTSCKNFPRFVGQSILANDNKIESIDGGVNNIPRVSIRFNNNNIRTVEPLSQLSGDVISVSIGGNKITSFKGLEHLSTENLFSYNNLISSWDFVPKDIEQLEISNNKLTSWRGMPTGMTALYIKNNWDVVDFEDFESVSHTLEMSSSRWNSSKRSDQEIRDLIRDVHSKTPPAYIYVGKFLPV
jgi:Leucine-rich repeat (LRR) protein